MNFPSFSIITQKVERVHACLMHEKSSIFYSLQARLCLKALASTNQKLCKFEVKKICKLNFQIETAQVFDRVHGCLKYEK